MGLGAGAFGGLDGAFHVPRVVQGIEDAEDIHAVLGGGVDEGVDDIVGEVGVLDDILAAQQHHVRCFRARLLQGVEAVEGKLVEEAQAGVDGGTAPGFQGTEADVIEVRADREHLGGGHAGGGEDFGARPGAPCC